VYPQLQDAVVARDHEAAALEAAVQQAEDESNRARMLASQVEALKALHHQQQLQQHQEAHHEHDDHDDDGRSEGAAAALLECEAQLEATRQQVLELQAQLAAQRAQAEALQAALLDTPPPPSPQPDNPPAAAGSNVARGTAPVRGSGVDGEGEDQQVSELMSQLNALHDELAVEIRRRRNAEAAAEVAQQRAAAATADAQAAAALADVARGEEAAAAQLISERDDARARVAKLSAALEAAEGAATRGLQKMQELERALAKAEQQRAETAAELTVTQRKLQSTIDRNVELSGVSGEGGHG
jgi:hypothetical protein